MHLLRAEVRVALVAVDVEPRVGRDRAAQRMHAADVGIGVQPALHLESPVALGVQLARLVHHDLVAREPEYPARLDAVAVAAQQFVAGQAACLAHDVPQRHVDAALGGQVPLDEGHGLVHLLHIERVEARNQRRQQVVDHVHHAHLRLAVDVLARDGLSDAFDALVRHDAHQHMRLVGHATGGPLHRMGQGQVNGDSAHAHNLHGRSSPFASFSQSNAIRYQIVAPAIGEPFWRSPRSSLALPVYNLRNRQ